MKNKVFLQFQAPEAAERFCSQSRQMAGLSTSSCRTCLLDRLEFSVIFFRPCVTIRKYRLVYFKNTPMDGNPPLGQHALRNQPAAIHTNQHLQFQKLSSSFDFSPFQKTVFSVFQAITNIQWNILEQYIEIICLRFKNNFY